MDTTSTSYIILEIIKITIPALIVFVTVYLVLKNFLGNQVQLEQMRINSDYSEGTRTKKIQAYERLMLFCDRMDIVNMTTRVYAPEMSADQLKQALLISLQREYEHNSAQQIYTSEALWKVISEAKSASGKVIRAASAVVSPSAPASELLKEISKKMEQISINPSDQAKSAIRSEASVLLS
jgi:hypothetical protein